MGYDYSDEVLIDLARQSSEEAKDILYSKYKYIIEVELKKYLKVACVLGYDYSDLYQDALVGFADALVSYREDKDSSLPSFITMCVSRKLQVSIEKAKRKKNRMMVDAMSLDHKYESLSAPLKEIISDHSSNDPLSNLLKEENFQYLLYRIKTDLSDSEYQVYSLMINGLKYDEIALVLDKEPKSIDNCIQRIKGKVKDILQEE